MNKLYLIIIFFCCALMAMGQGQIKRPHKTVKTKVEISEPDGYINGHGYVDLGLPSGTKWAVCNVGATTPGEIGNHYSWGEITTKEKYEMDEGLLVGVHIDSVEGNAKYDVATANWGLKWKLPSKSEMQELLQYCKIEDYIHNSVKGLLFIGLNGKNIFISKGGYCDFGTKKPYNVGLDCYLWTGNANYKYHGPSYPEYKDDHYSTAMWATSHDTPHLRPAYRGWGYSIRPVFCE